VVGEFALAVLALSAAPCGIMRAGGRGSQGWMEDFTGKLRRRVIDEQWKMKNGGK
jgi:hypothetical protein